GVATARDLVRDLDESSVLIAADVTPSLAAQVDWTKVRGFATDAGSRTYHTAILARSLEVPAVVGLHDASQRIQPGEVVVIDGAANEVIVDPSPQELARAAHHVDDRPPAAAADAERRRPASTADGVPIRLDANIEFPDDLAAARYSGAEGIGLYRTEFLLTMAPDAATNEDRQYEIYRRMRAGRGAGDGRRRRRRFGAAWRAGAARPNRRDDRDTGRGVHRRPAGARSRLFHHRHQRPHPVLSGRRSRRRARVALVRAAASGDPAD